MKKNEQILTRTVTEWWICIDYCRLNCVTHKDHFPLPFMNQMLERLVGQAYHCFLDGHSWYNQIIMDPPDQEKTTSISPFRVFAYGMMPFGFCNASTKFQRYMLSIFSNMIENSIEVFMDDFYVFGTLFDYYHDRLNNILKRCIKTNLVLNWENVILWWLKALVSATKSMLKEYKSIKPKLRW